MGYSEDWSIDDSRLKAENNDYNKFLAQQYDYNQGTLKSDYYRFVVEFYEKKNVADTAGFTILTNKTSQFRNNELSVEVKSGAFKSYLDGSKDEFSKSRTHSWDTYKYEVTLERIGSSNNFDATIQVYKNNSLFYTRSDDVTLNKIYPTIWARSKKVGYIKSFEAYRLPQIDDSATIIGLSQNDTTMDISWSVDTENFPNVKIAYSPDSTVSFSGNDRIIFDGSSASSANIALTEAMKSGGYIGLKGYGSTTTETNVVAFTYQSPPEDFGFNYTDTDNTYKFTWSDENVLSYEIMSNGVIETRYPGNETITLTGISDPTTVKIRTKSSATVGAGENVSAWKFAIRNTLDPVENLAYTKTDQHVTITWDAYPAMNKYILLKKEFYR
jgi:hypothetical protein